MLERDDLIDRGVHLPGLGDVSAEQGRIGHVEAERGRLAEVRALRDAVHVVLHARARGERPVEAAVAMVNDASLAAPVAPLIDAGGRRDERTTAADPWLVLRGVIARSAIELATTEPIALAECEAPSCGMLFRATSARQKWCSSGCGNRARVARHAARRRTGGAERRPRA